MDEIPKKCIGQSGFDYLCERLQLNKNFNLINRKNLDVKVDFVQFSTEKLTQIRQATNADPILCELWARILQGWPKSRRELHKDLQTCWSY